MKHMRIYNEHFSPDVVERTSFECFSVSVFNVNWMINSTGVNSVSTIHFINHNIGEMLIQFYSLHCHDTAYSLLSAALSGRAPPKTNLRLPPM